MSKEDGWLFCSWSASPSLVIGYPCSQTERQLDQRRAQPLLFILFVLSGRKGRTIRRVFMQLFRGAKATSPERIAAVVPHKVERSRGTYPIHQDSKRTIVFLGGMLYIQFVCHIRGVLRQGVRRHRHGLSQGGDVGAQPLVAERGWPLGDNHAHCIRRASTMVIRSISMVRSDTSISPMAPFSRMLSFRLQ